MRSDSLVPGQYDPHSTTVALILSSIFSAFNSPFIFAV